jgi:hypothetical protein
MTRFPKFVLSFGAVALAVCMLTLAVPRAAHAIAATLVQVTNTTANPVIIQNVDAPGRSPYQKTCSFIGTQHSCTLPAVPADTELVIQTVSIEVTSGVPTTGFLTTTGGGGVVTMLFPVNVSLGDFVSVTQPLTMYADPGTSPYCGVPLPSTEPAGATIQFSITGYTVSLP